MLSELKYDPEIERMFSEILDWMCDVFDRYLYYYDQQDVTNELSNSNKYSVSTSKVDDDFVSIDIVNL